jgi:hypothetical protein
VQNGAINIPWRSEANKDWFQCQNLLLRPCNRHSIPRGQNKSKHLPDGLSKQSKIWKLGCISQYLLLTFTMFGRCFLLFFWLILAFRPDQWPFWIFLSFCSTHWIICFRYLVHFSIEIISEGVTEDTWTHRKIK